MNYGQKIAELRKKAQMTQAELGEKLNVTSQAVSKWENGLSEPDLNTINKICSLYGIAANDFFGTPAVNNHTEQPTGEASRTNGSATGLNGDDADSAKTANHGKNEEQPKAVCGYCERCNKPVGFNEYKVFSRKEESSSGKTVVYKTVQEILCNSCAEKKERELLEAKNRKRRTEIAMEKSNLRAGLIWGGIAAVVALIAAIVLTVNKQPAYYTVTAYISVYGLFAMVSQVIWDNSVGDLFSLFFKSFTMPGVIFSLSIDGIVWAIAVKLLLSLLSITLSVLVFLVGVVISMVYAMFAFPFGISRKLKTIKNI